MEKFSFQLYNLNEYLLLRFFRIITGFKLAFNPDLEKIYLIPLDTVKEFIIKIIKNQIFDEFGIEVISTNKQIDYSGTVRGNFINTSRLARKFKKVVSHDKSAALMSISNYWLSPTNFLISRIIHTFQPILGITYLKWGICFLTTLQEHLPKNFIQFAAVHEVGHLLGKHGYPLQWLKNRRTSKENK
ncbi:MAG: hypothetical protein ACFFD2_13845 [Promethearchaeota archaeon]